MFFHKSEAKKLLDMINNPDFNAKKPETKEYIMTHLLHLSDISNPTKVFNVYNIWVGKIFTEFFNQVKIKYNFREIMKKILIYLYQ